MSISLQTSVISAKRMKLDHHDIHKV